MTIEEKDFNQLNKSLSQKFRSGDKWVAWDDFKGSLRSDGLMTFRNISSAQKFCEKNTGDVGENDFYYYKFKPIVNVLKELSGASSVSQNRINITALEEQIKQYSVDPYHTKKSVVELLSNGLYHPVFVKQQILPWKDIESYKVVEHEYPRGMVYEVGHSSITHGNFGSYYEAQKCFEELVAKNGSWQLHQPEIKLIGMIKGQKLALDFEDFPQPGTGVLFKIANHIWSKSEKEKYEVNSKHKPDEPVEIHQQKMARFNSYNSTLDFFNGELQKVAPNAKIDFMSFGSLSTEPFTVVNSLQQAFKQHNTLGKDDVKIKGLRFKPGL